MSKDSIVGDTVVGADPEGVSVWLLDDELNIVDVSAAVCDALQLQSGEVIGKNIREVDVIHSMSENARVARLNKVLSSGQPDTIVIWLLSPSLGWARVITTATLLSDNRILNVAHDITEVDHRLIWMRSEVFQRLPVLIADRDGYCLMGTLGMAEICGFESEQEMAGKSVCDMPLVALNERNLAMVALSRKSGEPLTSIEWTLDESGLHQFVVTRISLQAGSRMIILQEITGNEPHLYSPQEKLLRAANVEPHLTRRQADVLMGWWHGEQREETATRLGIKLGTVDHHRAKIKHLFGVQYPKDVIGAIRGTLLADVLDQISLPKTIPSNPGKPL
jgi:DNA-binding CsgD family transcriptional regulator